MKKLFVLSVLATVFAVSCKSKTGVATKEVKTISAVDYASGKNLFEASCGKCHDLPNPKEYSAEKWVGIMKSMSPKAKLNEAQSTLVYNYITNYKK